MKLYIATALSALVCLFGSAPTDESSPGAQEFHKLYGEPIMERYAVRSGISLTVEYGSDRKACQLLLAPEQLLVEVKNSGDLMPSKGVSALLEELLPLTTRGAKINSATVQVGGNALLKTDYPYVSIRRFCASQSCVSSSENQDVRTLVVFNRSSCPKHAE